jgi:molybdopterin-guanine dinucleotide biosynthesis protein B
MKLISICGVSKAGKTTIAEVLIAGLKARGHTVGSIKSIHIENFTMDTPGTNTFRHRAAGASTVCALSRTETDFLHYTALPLSEILPRFTEEFVVMEGVSTGDFPKIIVGHTVEDVLGRLDENTVAISGRAAALFSEGYEGLPSFDPLTQPEQLVDFVERICFEKLPGLTAKNCGACGMDCKTMTTKIIKGEAARADCKNETLISLTIGGKEIELVPFVQKALRKVIVGFASELRGYKEGEPIEIRIGK